MRNVIEVATAEGWATESWLVAGKGPSFDARHFNTCEQTLALNHVVNAVEQTTVLHCVDLEVADVCAAAIDDRADYLLMPWCPNIDLKIQEKTLTALAAAHPILAKMDAAGRLLAYNRRESPAQHADLPTISVTYFSAEGAFGVLAACGVRRIETMGLDGGQNYAAAFASLNPLENGRPSYDRQFPELERLVRRHGIEWTRLKDNWGCLTINSSWQY